MSDGPGRDFTHVLIRIIRWAVLLPLALAVLLFVIDNRRGVVVSFPLTGFTMQAPLFLILLLVFLTGLAIGATTAWLGSFKYRRRAHREKKAREALSREMEDVMARRAKPVAQQTSPYLPPED